MNGKNHQPLQKIKPRVATHVFRGSKEGNSGRTISILRTCCCERTTPQSLRGAIREQCGDSSMDQGERANFEYSAAACHLPDNHGDIPRINGKVGE